MKQIHENEVLNSGFGGQEEATGDQELLVFLRMASMRLRKQTQTLEETEGFSARVRTMRMLEELIREQAPNENTGSSTGSAR